MAQILLVIETESEVPWVVDAAAELASDMSAHVQVVAVDHIESQRFSSLPRSEVEDTARSMAEAAAARLAEAGINNGWEVRQGGRPADSVLEAADAVDADVIVVGASPRRPVVERVLGSLALELVRRANRQVLVVTPPRD